MQEYCYKCNINLIQTEIIATRKAASLGCMEKDLRINTDHILKSDHKFHLAMIHQMMCFGVGKTIDSRVTIYYLW